tara:strand:- start:289 stop:465 length:177 start_codon:yes stop_codon:yes gene_type:complete
MKSRPPPILLPHECAKRNRKRGIPKISKRILSKHAFIKPTPIKNDLSDYFQKCNIKPD